MTFSDYTVSKRKIVFQFYSQNLNNEKIVYRMLRITSSEDKIYVKYHIAK